jgi:hypothetical protein
MARQRSKLFFERVRLNIAKKYMLACKAWRGSHSQRDQQVVDLYKDILLNDIGETQKYVEQLQIKSLTI